jgi:hypothetical protein
MTAIRSLCLLMLAIIRHSFCRRFAGHLGQRIRFVVRVPRRHLDDVVVVVWDNRTLSNRRLT